MIGVGEIVHHLLSYLSRESSLLISSSLQLLRELFPQNSLIRTNILYQRSPVNFNISDKVRAEMVGECLPCSTPTSHRSSVCLIKLENINHMEQQAGVYIHPELLTSTWGTSSLTLRNQKIQADALYTGYIDYCLIK